jgi:hypothetical protein
MNCNRDDSSNNNGNSNLYRELRERVTKLSFPVFQILVILWLGAKGFSHMSSLGRVHRRGRRFFGGADYLAQTPGSSGVSIAIRICHWKTPVQRRVVDELYGFLLRHHVPMGLLVTNSEIAPMARIAPAEFPGRSIRLVSVTQLVGSLAALGLGIDLEPKPRLDERFFQMLDRVGLASRLTATIPGPDGASPDCAPMPAILSEPDCLDPRGPQGSRLPLILAAFVVVALILWIMHRGGLL